MPVKIKLSCLRIRKENGTFGDLTTRINDDENEKAYSYLLTEE